MGKNAAFNQRRKAISRKIERGFEEAMMKLSGKRMHEIMKMLDPLSFDELKFVNTLSGTVVEGVELLCEMDREIGGDGNPDYIWEYVFGESGKKKSTARCKVHLVQGCVLQVIVQFERHQRRLIIRKKPVIGAGRQKALQILHGLHRKQGVHCRHDRFKPGLIPALPVQILMIIVLDQLRVVPLRSGRC